MRSRQAHPMGGRDTRERRSRCDRCTADFSRGATDIPLAIIGSVDARLSIERRSVAMRALSWINFILGLWLIVAAFVFARGVNPVMAEEICLGIVIAILAASAAVRPTAAMSWLVVLAGLWTLIAPGVINYSGAPPSRTNDIIVG